MTLLESGSHEATSKSVIVNFAEKDLNIETQISRLERFRAILRRPGTGIVIAMRAQSVYMINSISQVSKNGYSFIDIVISAENLTFQSSRK